jgi:ABC-type sugar transport system ATPase subunit
LDTPTLSAKGVTVTFGGVDVVASVDIELRAGEVHAIVGENGAGKSSLAKAIAGVYRMREGTLSLNGETKWFKNPREALRAGIALIHQEPQTFPDLTVAENVFVGNRPGWLHSLESCVLRSRELLAQLGASIDPRAQMGGLSVAQRQLVELAAALAHEAKVWMFDETTAPLTPKETSELFQVITKLKSQGKAVAFVSHHLAEVFAVSDRITVLRDGKKVAEKTTSETNPQEIVRLMVGREIEHARLHGANPGETVLETNNLTGEGFANVSIKVCKGEVVGLAGLVGAGRTEFARALFGHTRPTAGTIKFENRETRVRSPRDASHKRIALVPEDRIHDGLLLPQSIAFNATLADLPRVSRLGWLDNTAIANHTRQFADRLNLAHRGQSQPAAQLSGGNQQKVVLSKWLMTAPKLLILDEPTRGVDVGAKREVHRTVRELADQGLAVLMVSSDLTEVLTLCDRIIVMRKGLIVGELKAEDATEERIMSLATGSAMHG